jgi:hypothetical protein
MALPSVLQVAVPIAIQNLTLQYKNKEFIGEQVFPIVPVPAPQVKVMKYSKANMFKLIDGELYRAEGALTRRGNYNIETQNITPRQVSYEMPVTDELIDIATNFPGQLPLQPIIDAVQHCVMKIDLYKEKEIASKIYGSTWGDGTMGGTGPSGGNGGWALTTTSNSFITDVFAAKAYILRTTGVKPNVLVMDYDTFIAQQANPVVADKIKYTQRSVVAQDILAALLQLDEVVVGSAIYTSQVDNSKRTSAQFVGTPIWNPSTHGNAFLYYREAPGLRAMSAGFQFRLPYMGSMRYIRGYRDEQVRSTIYQITEQVEIAPVALDVGWAWTRTIS